MHISAIACPFVIVALLLAGMPAHAVIGPVAEEPLPDGARFATPETFTMTLPTPWRTISKDGRFTTAVCPGNLDTPYCALETLFACHVDGGEACFRVVLDREFAATLAGGWNWTDVRRFRITGMRIIDPRDVYLFSIRLEPTLGVNVGDIILFTEQMSCEIQVNPKNEAVSPFECDGNAVGEGRYIMQRSIDGWGVFTWGGRYEIP